MRKAILTACMLLMCGLWAVAQQSEPAQTTPSSSSSQATSSANQSTIQGCLSGSNGNYTLTDKSGTAYQLTGKTEKLSSHVGHEISVTGTAQASATASSGAASPSATAPSGGATSSAGQSFEVKSFKHVAATCSSSPSGTSPNPPR